MLARWRESLTLILIALLPLHAMAVTVLTHVLEGSGSAPLFALAIWKEVALGLILLFAVFEIIFSSRDNTFATRTRPFVDVLDMTILIGILSACTLEYILHTPQSTNYTSFLLGFKYDFIPLVAFFLLRRVSWSSSFRQSSAWVLLATGAIFSLAGLVALHVPMTFFTALGYSDLHSLYLPHAPLAAFQMVEGTALRRLQSVMSGPNQFGLWLLLPIAASLFFLPDAVVRRRKIRAVAAFVSLSLCLTALYYTYSRAAWVGASCMGVGVLFVFVVHRVRSIVHRSLILLTLGVVFAVVLSVGFTKAPDVFLRSQSLLGHLQKPLQALDIITEHPLGLGLGTAGPASNHLSDTCVFFGLGADISWAAQRQDICVFTGGVQRHPVGKVCGCPLLTENWYLQWGVEMGWTGLVLSLVIVLFVLWNWFSQRPTTAYPLLAFVGISIGALFLHAWEDAGVAYSVWVLIAAVLPVADGRTK